MSQKTNIYSDDWCEMIFTKKNHDYGAFMLRKQSWKRQLWATLIAITFFTVAISSPVILKTILPERNDSKNGEVTFTDVLIDPPKEHVEIEEIIPVQIYQKSIKFDVPDIVPDEEVTELNEIKSQSEVIDSKKVISTIDVNIGSDDPNDDVLKYLNSSNSPPKVEKPAFIVEQMPEFNGGDVEMFKFLRDNIKYPELARIEGTEGTVHLTFVISKQGKIENIRLLRGIGSGCDEEAIRVVGSMPSWKPGKQNGFTVPVQFNLPINFKLNN